MVIMSAAVGNRSLAAQLDAVSADVQTPIEVPSLKLSPQEKDCRKKAVS